MAEKYAIEDTDNLRVDSADRIIAMHRSAPGEPAPIDNAVLAIWLKRLLLVNSPNMIFRILSPILQAKNVVLVELTENGEKQMSSTAPMVPPTEMATTDPERYAMMKTDHDAYIGEL